jgi:hypothetical protein
MKRKNKAQISLMSLDKLEMKCIIRLKTSKGQTIINAYNAGA